MVKQKDIIRSLKSIDQRDNGLSFDIGRIKNTFMQNNKKATNVQVKYSLIMPSIWIEYIMGGKKQYSHVRDFIQTRAMKANPTYLINIYERLYRTISIKYEDLIQFALQKAVDVKKQKYFTYNSVMNMYDFNKKRLMFYYCKHQDVIAFSIFDRDLFNIEFDSFYVYDLRKYLDREYRTYLDFQDDQIRIQQKIKYPSKQDKYYQNKSKQIQYKIQQPAQKQQKQKKYIQKNYQFNSPNKSQSIPIKKIKQKLNAILSKNLQPINKQLNYMYDKYDRLVQQYQKDSTLEIGIDILDNQIHDLQIKLKEFENSMSKIEQNISKDKNNERILRLNLKKAIISENQLESKLPIIAKKQQIFQKLDNNNLLILQGETGSGKSTQLPQLLCQYYNLFEKQKTLPVLITQPRKLATKSIAQRVAFEMKQDVGSFVDYIASSNKYINHNAKIIFKLDRLVLDDLTTDQILSGYSCLVLDQAHERTISIDVIVGLITNLLNKRSDFKVIITSASMDVELFERYFKSQQKKFKFDVIKVPGRVYPVKIVYKNYNSLSQSYLKILKVLDQEIFINKSAMKNQYRGHVLVFCTGVDEINKLVNKYSQKLDQNQFAVYALHGNLSAQDQSMVFKQIRQHKIIFCSRIAQTAITIEGVTVVVDPGQDRQEVYNQKNKISSRVLKDISQSSAKQRAGRAGRTANGFCIRLYSESKFNNFRPNKIPEIQNNALQVVVLRLKSLNIKNVTNFSYLSPPQVKGLEASEQLLKMIGALDHDGSINTIGRLLVRIPIQPFLSRAIAESLIYEKILGQRGSQQQYLFKLNNKELQKIRYYTIFKSVIQILCMIVNSSNLFYISEQNRQKGQNVKFTQFSSEKGDFFYLRNIYDIFMDCLVNQKNTGRMKQFLNKYFLNFKALKEAKDLNQQINTIVTKIAQINFKVIGNDVINKCRNKIKNCNNYQDIVLSCLLSSFCANLCLYSQHIEIGYTMLSTQYTIQIYGTSNLSLQGINPKWIVAYDLYQNEKGRLYCKIAHEVKQQFLQQMAQQYLWDRFKMKELMKSNPFYKNKNYNLSTVVYRQIYNDYLQRRQFSYFKFLNELKIVFSEISISPKITIYLYLQRQDNFEQKIESFQKYLINIEANMKEIQRYNYVGNCKVLLNQNFEIHGIEFQTEETIVEIVKLNLHMFQIICNNCYGYGRVQLISNDSIKIYLQQQSYKTSLQQHLESLKIYGHFKFQIYTMTKHKNTPKLNILMYFFAGTSSSEEVILYGYSQSNTQEMTDMLIQAIEASKKHGDTGFHYKISQEIQRVLIPKGRDSIKIKTQLDEFNMEQILLHLKKMNFLNPAFIFPKKYAKFRNPEFPEARYSDGDWKTQIRGLLNQLKINQKHYLLNISENHNNYIRGSYESERINLVATITTFNESIYQILYKHLNNRCKLGLEKVHIKNSFTFLATTISISVYKIFRSRLCEIIQKSQSQGYNIGYYCQSKFPKGVQIVQIYLSSNFKDHLFMPLRDIRKMFMPKKLKLSLLQFEILKEQYTNIFSAVQDLYSYDNDNDVYFQLNNIHKQVDMYCKDGLEKACFGSLLNQINEYKINSKYVSYKGKNLNQILKILQIKKQQQSHLLYEICFKTRHIILRGPIQTIQSCLNKIDQLNQQIMPECSLCQDAIKIPFKLINCSHLFCWNCLSGYLREVKLKFKEKIQCPYYQCNKLINLHDIKLIITQQQFAELCDIKIQEHVKANNEYVSCNNCHQIFEVKYIQNKLLNCHLCGNRYTLEEVQQISDQTIVNPDQRIANPDQVCQGGYMVSIDQITS